MQRNEIPTPKIDARHASVAGQEDLRRRGMEMLQSRIPQRTIAERLGVSASVVYKWSCLLKEYGDIESAIKAKRRGPKEETADKRMALTRAQQQVIRMKIQDKMPAQYKFDFALWTTASIQELIVWLYGVRVSRVTICRYLREWGMTPQRPKKCAIQKNPVAVEKWLKEEYPTIARRAKQEGAQIFWEDETSIQQDTNAVKGYSPIGKTPVIMQDRRSCYGAPVMVSAVNNQGLMHFKFQKKAVNAEDFITFLEELLEDNRGRKLFVITDNARIHHARIVKEWAESNKDRIELFYLPTYSPDLNPDELLNRQLKTTLRNLSAKTHDECRQIAETFMTDLKSAAHLIRKLFDSIAVRYARADACYDLCLPAPSKIMYC